MTGRATTRSRRLASLGLCGLTGWSAAGCLADAFESLADSAPVRTDAFEFPGRPSAAVTVALTVPADDEGRGRVLFMDDGQALGWYRPDEAGDVELEYISAESALALAGSAEAMPTFGPLAVVEGRGVAEGLAVIRGEVDRIARFRVADFSRPTAVVDDMQVYPWIDGVSRTVTGPIAAAELDIEASNLPEALAVLDDGTLVIWDALGTERASYEEARAMVLADDPAAFDGDAAPEGYGLTLCPDLPATAIAGGLHLDEDEDEDEGGGASAAVLVGDAVVFVGSPAEGVTPSLVGAPRYACELATLALPGAATQLLAADVDGDGDRDLLVGAPAGGVVWVYADPGAGIDPGAGPTTTLEPDPAESGSFGSTLASVELGGDAGWVIAVGAPETTVGGRVDVGRVHLFDPSDGARLRTIEDLEPRTGSRHGLGVHGLDLSGREELVITGAHEVRAHWTVVDGDPRP